MQDSLEDYLKIANNMKDTAFGKSQDAVASILATAEIKRKCEDYAQKIVEFLIDGQLHSHIFIKSLNFINVALYEDIVEERAITKLCGYPVCGKDIPDMPHQQYLILSKVNKVYDITERKKYCSNFCYKASIHIKSQIDETPLWLRKSSDSLSYNLLQDTKTGLTPGAEIVDGIDKSTIDQSFTSIASFTEACLDEAEELEMLPKAHDNENSETIDTSVISEGISTKSILKQPGQNENRSEKRVKFGSDSVVPSQPLEEEQKQLSQDIKEICESLNINLNLDNKEPNETMSIDVNKMNETIERVKESEEKRQKVAKSLSTPVQEFIEEKVENTDVSKREKIIEPQPSTSSTSLQFQHETNEEMTSIFKSLNINRNSHPQARRGRLHNENVSETIPIDLEKMNKVIKKVEDSERKRSKPVVFINSNIHPDHTKIMEPPKYSQRINDIINKPSTLLANDLKTFTEKVKNIAKKDTKKATNIHDEKMKQILEKLKNKNTQKAPTVIMVDTVQNPEMIINDFQTNERKKEINMNPLKPTELTAIKTCFTSWLTIESFLFLHGETKIKSVILREKLEGYFSKDKVTELQTSQRLKYVEICKKLQLKEIVEQKFDNQCVGNAAEGLKPVPTISQLKKEVAAMDVKVQAFYSGEVVARSRNRNINKSENIDTDDIVIPLVDVASQTAMRRNIFNKSIRQFINKHILELSLDENTSELVFDLIRTFKLDANNIVFKPVQWNIIALILINCLQWKDSNLKNKLETTAALVYISETLRKCTILDDIFFEDINLLLDNVDLFIKNYIEQTNDS